MFSATTNPEIAAGMAANLDIAAGSLDLSVENLVERLCLRRACAGLNPNSKPPPSGTR